MWEIKNTVIKDDWYSPDDRHVVVTLKHEDGRKLEITYNVELFCDITLYGDRIDHSERSLTDSDDCFEYWTNFYIENREFTLEEVEDTLGRNYWANFTDFKLVAFDLSGKYSYSGDTKAIKNGSVDIDYFEEALDFGTHLSKGLEHEIETALKNEAHSRVDQAEHWADSAYLELVLVGEQETV